MLQIRPAVQPHAHERRFPHRLGQPGEVSAKSASIEWKRVNRAALLDATGMIGMIIRIVLAEGELHLGIFFEEAHHRAGILQER
jgi:hypothetical protein